MVSLSYKAAMKSNKSLGLAIKQNKAKVVGVIFYGKSTMSRWSECMGFIEYNLARQALKM